MENYHVIRPLGSGSFGTVVVALEKVSNQKVAMKLIGKVGKQDKVIQSLKEECETHKNLRHPNVILMLDSFETGDSIVVVTELAHGDLYKVYPQYSRWHAESVNKIACDLVSALHYLHSRRILHRDLKPQNILIGIDGKAKVCDFGFAKKIAMDSYMLTSMKGTPLYMAPEIIMEKPYDQSADLWSLGCILYELLVGQPPFHTNSLFVLRKMMLEADIVWHDFIVGDALLFLQGLLEKDDKKRLTWPDLLYHPFVCGKLVIDTTVADCALTNALSPSQELVKESERQQLQKELEQCSRVYRKAMKKYAQAQKKLKRWNSEMTIGRRAHLPLEELNRPPNAAKHAHVKPKPLAQPQEDKLNVMLQNLKLQENNVTLAKQPELEAGVARNVDEGKTASSSPDIMSSSSDCETESDDETDDDGRKTVIQDDSHKLRGSSVEIMSENMDVSGERGVLFTLDTSGSTDLAIDTEEWIDFIMKTMREVVDNPKSLCEKGVLTMVVGPLKNTTAEAVVLEKIAVLLSLPFTLDEEQVHESSPGLISDFQALYAATKVLPLLLFACKLIVVNRVSGLSLTFEKIVELLTHEDLDGLEKCFRLVTFLVHLDESFVTQFCDSVCVLKLSAILQLFLKLDVVRTSLAVDTVAVLCQLLRIFPNNKSIVEDVFLVGNNKSDRRAITQEELWRLVSHKNPLIQSKSIRLFIYLFLSSDRVKHDFVNKHRPTVWNVLRKAAISSDFKLRETAKFAIQVLSSRLKQNQIVTEKSNSTTSTSNIRDQELPHNGNEVFFAATTKSSPSCNVEKAQNETIINFENQELSPVEDKCFNDSAGQGAGIVCANDASR